MKQMIEICRGSGGYTGEYKAKKALGLCKPMLIMMCGLQGSGKSTCAKELAKHFNAEVFSSDELRIELYDDVNDQKHNNKLYHELHKRIKDCLKSGKDAIYDATNVNSKRRKSFLQELNKIDCFKCCVIMATPYEQCLNNNKSRDRVVPGHVIDRTYRSFNPPYWFEGWDSIELMYWTDAENSMDIMEQIHKYMDYNQDNPHHTLTLGEHCMMTGHKLKDNRLLFYAGLLHDLGKPHVKSFINSKKEATDIAHYYNHEHVGAYDSLFYEYDGVNALDVSVLIDLHMRSYVWERDNNERLRNKCKKLWGDKLFANIKLLHEADKQSH